VPGPANVCACIYSFLHYPPIPHPLPTSSVVSSQLQINHHQHFFLSFLFLFASYPLSLKGLGTSNFRSCHSLFARSRNLKDPTLATPCHQLIAQGHHIRFNNHFIINPRPELFSKESNYLARLCSGSHSNRRLFLHVSGAHGSKTEPAPDQQFSTTIRISATQHVAAAKSFGSTGPRC
jgi:hypothetical protein